MEYDAWIVVSGEDSISFLAQLSGPSTLPLLSALDGRVENINVGVVQPRMDACLLHLVFHSLPSTPDTSPISEGVLLRPETSFLPQSAPGLWPIGVLLVSGTARHTS